MHDHELDAIRLNPQMEVVLRPSRVKWIGLFALLTIFTLFGFFIGYQQHDRVGYVAALFCGALAAFALYQLASGKSYLKLGARGMSVRALLNQFDVEWTNVGDIGVVLFRHNVHVVFNYIHIPPEAAVRAKRNRRVLKYDEALPETYGLDAEKLAELIVARRDAAATKR